MRAREKRNYCVGLSVGGSGPSVGRSLGRSVCWLVARSVSLFAGWSLARSGCWSFQCTAHRDVWDGRIRVCGVSARHRLAGLACCGPLDTRRRVIRSACLAGTSCMGKICCCWIIGGGFCPGAKNFVFTIQIKNGNASRTPKPRAEPPAIPKTSSIEFGGYVGVFVVVLVVFRHAPRVLVKFCGVCVVLVASWYAEVWCSCLCACVLLWSACQCTCECTVCDKKIHT